ncbi:MAG: 4-hydroxythreonine-4-phosphate dehydrogenase PdxA [Bacteroidetes bacterium]|nr:4-hydroxythreonine-4-phosphate dehydrogenase PdxA [Bacteroidota bacterium]
MNKFIFTCGDINGIGPEICIKTINRFCTEKNSQFIFIAPSNVIKKLKHEIGFNFNPVWIRNHKLLPDIKGNVVFIPLPITKIKIGSPTSESGKASYLALTIAKEILINKNADALVTAPISKSAFEMGGINFPGHTELLAEWANTKSFSMMFLSNIFKCNLATIHEPIKNVSKLITKKKLETLFDIVGHSLINDFGLSDPRIAVLGLNPHAGESGKIGKEELNIILPAIKENRKWKVEGPFVPDAFFGKKMYKNYDSVIGMYHDQVLIPFKMICFDKGVNYTAGLPFIRTSPDHGTAYDISWQNKANESSMDEAYKWAKKILKLRMADTTKK